MPIRSKIGTIHARMAQCFPPPYRRVPLSEMSTAFLPKGERLPTLVTFPVCHRKQARVRGMPSLLRISKIRSSTTVDSDHSSGPLLDPCTADAVLDQLLAGPPSALDLPLRQRPRGRPADARSPRRYIRQLDRGGHQALEAI